MLTPREVDTLLRLSGARFMAWDGALALPETGGRHAVLAPDDIAG